jgi:hypothetical protein
MVRSIECLHCVVKPVTFAATPGVSADGHNPLARIGLFQVQFINAVAWSLNINIEPLIHEVLDIGPAPFDQHNRVTDINIEIDQFIVVGQTVGVNMDHRRLGRVESPMHSRHHKGRALDKAVDVERFAESSHQSGFPRSEGTMKDDDISGF